MTVAEVVAKASGAQLVSKPVTLDSGAEGLVELLRIRVGGAEFSAHVYLHETGCSKQFLPDR
jgi:hypothetical protein